MNEQQNAAEGQVLHESDQAQTQRQCVCVYA